MDRGSRRVVARRRRPAGRHPRGRGVPRRDAAVHHLHLRHHRQAEGARAHERRLPHPGVVDPLGGVRREARRHPLVHRRPRLGDRAHLRAVRPAQQRDHAGDLRGHPRCPPAHPPFRDHRALRRDRLLHGAHPGAHPHDVVPGRRARRVRPVEHPAARLGGRGHQPGGLDVVPRPHRRRARRPSSTPGGSPRPARP